MDECHEASSPAPLLQAQSTLTAGGEARALESKLTAHGSHVMLDFTGFRVEAAEGAALVLRVMRDSVAQSSAREVHAKSVVLGADGASPPGFTSVVLIDESHVTAHCYSERGWLAVDVFTCGSNSKMPQVRCS